MHPTLLLMILTEVGRDLLTAWCLFWGAVIVASPLWLLVMALRVHSD